MSFVGGSLNIFNTLFNSPQQERTRLTRNCSSLCLTFDSVKKIASAIGIHTLRAEKKTTTEINLHRLRFHKCTELFKLFSYSIFEIVNAYDTTWITSSIYSLNQ